MRTTRTPARPDRNSSMCALRTTWLRQLLATLALSLSMPVGAAPATNVILVTADGLRWQEVFRGADAALLGDERFTPKDYKSFPPHQSAGIEAARRQLLPFFWNVIATQGSLIGARDHGSRMRVTNPWWFSYPGYNEILTGRADPAIDSNDSKPNANTTVLEWLNRQPGFAGKVQAFTSWDAFPFIINAKRSGVPVSAGFATAANPSPREQWLNELQGQVPIRWPTVRFDAFTHQFALEAMREDRPRVIYISYGETDDFAHEGKYDQYLDAARRFDGFLQQLWDTIQSDRFYRNRTVLLVTTDHGRGETPIETWQHHSSKQAVQRNESYLSKYPNGIEGSDQIWFAALGPGIAARGVIGTTAEREQAQVAATLLQVLGIPSARFDPKAGAPLVDVLAGGE